ncbi:hypothetical protein GCM10011588_62760 [Nocardia jinanensis]|uniref:Uncharacterized protein n=1 Tax=Nocardia jinanensis TaxID=382504 RepID=A0A917RX44_9NOCA|nr:hypothetical protein GCM10011588_62760 [Nocardia jinanensis]
MKRIGTIFANIAAACRSRRVTRPLTGIDSTTSSEPVIRARNAENAATTTCAGEACRFPANRSSISESWSGSLRPATWSLSLQRAARPDRLTGLGRSATFARQYARSVSKRGLSWYARSASAIARRSAATKGGGCLPSRMAL